MSSQKQFSINDVSHNEPERAFELWITPSKADKCYLTYEDVSPEVVAFTHTFVPPSGRGKGLAELLAFKAFDWARHEHKKVDVVCTYLVRFVEKYPEWKDIVV